VAGWPAGGQALPDARTIEWVHSMRPDGNVWSRGKGIPGQVVGMVWWGEDSDQEGTGREMTVYSAGGGSGGVSQRVARQNSLQEQSWSQGMTVPWGRTQAREWGVVYGQELTGWRGRYWLAAKGGWARRKVGWFD